MRHDADIGAAVERDQLDFRIVDRMGGQADVEPAGNQHVGDFHRAARVQGDPRAAVRGLVFHDQILNVVLL